MNPGIPLSLFWPLITLFFSGGASLTDYLDTESYWRAQGVEISAAALAERAGHTVAADPSDIDKWVVQLGAASFSDRERADRELAALGEAVKPALQTAAGSNDPEVAMRARNLLENLKPRADFDPELDRWMIWLQLERMEDPDAVQLLQELAENRPEFAEIAERRSFGGFTTTLQPGVFPVTPEGEPEIRLQISSIRKLEGLEAYVRNSATLQEFVREGVSLLGEVRLGDARLSIDNPLVMESPGLRMRVDLDTDPVRLREGLKKLGAMEREDGSWMEFQGIKLVQTGPTRWEMEPVDLESVDEVLHPEEEPPGYPLFLSMNIPGAFHQHGPEVLRDAKTLTISSGWEEEGLRVRSRVDFSNEIDNAAVETYFKDQIQESRRLLQGDAPDFNTRPWIDVLDSADITLFDQAVEVHLLVPDRSLWHHLVWLETVLEFYRQMRENARNRQNDPGLIFQDGVFF